MQMAAAGIVGAVGPAFDAIGGELMSKYAGALAKNAWIFYYGLLDGDLPQIPYTALFQSNALFPRLFHVQLHKRLP